MGPHFYLQFLILFKILFSNKDGQESTNSLTIDSTSKINTSTNQDSSQSVNNYGSTNNNNINNNNTSIGSKYESQNKSEQSKPLSFQNASSKMSSNKKMNIFFFIFDFSYSCVFLSIKIFKKKFWEN